MCVCVCVCVCSFDLRASGEHRGECGPFYPALGDDNTKVQLDVFVLLLPNSKNRIISELISGEMSEETSTPVKPKTIRIKSSVPKHYDRIILWKFLHTLLNIVLC